MLEFTTCIRSHGVPQFPDPLPSGGFARSALGAIDPKSPQFTAAVKACWSLAVATGFVQTPAELDRHRLQLSAEDACIRKHGVPNMPDPDAQGSQALPPGIRPSSPQFQAAEKACAYLNP